jgi:hypothetical protein
MITVKQFENKYPARCKSEDKEMDINVIFGAKN